MALCQAEGNTAVVLLPEKLCKSATLSSIVPLKLVQLCLYYTMVWASLPEQAYLEWGSKGRQCPAHCLKRSQYTKVEGNLVDNLVNPSSTFIYFRSLGPHSVLTDSSSTGTKS